MSKAITLTIAYLEHAPHSAARDLQSLSIEDAAALLESVPARLSAPVVNKMIPWGAARCVAHMSSPRAAALLRRLAFHESASLLRLVSSERHSAILDEMPTLLAKRLRSSLRYPLSQVGAWTDPAVPILSTNDTVQDALGFLRDTATASHVFLESEEQGTFAGSISVASLLRSDRARRLSQLPIADIEPVSNRTSLMSMVGDSRWDEYLVLPVIGRRGAVLGGLSRSALRKGTKENVADQSRRDESLLAPLVSALGVASAGLLNLTISRRDGPSL